MLTVWRRVLSPMQVAHMNVTSYPGHTDILRIAEVALVSPSPSLPAVPRAHAVWGVRAPPALRTTSMIFSILCKCGITQTTEGAGQVLTLVKSPLLLP